MVVLYILAAIVMLCVLLLFVRVRVRVIYETGELRVWVKYLFVKMELTGERGEEDEKKKAKADKKKVRVKKKKDDTSGEKQAARDYVDFAIGNLKEIFMIIKKIFRAFKKHLIIRQLDLDLEFSTGDAANTALTFGYINMAVCNFIAFIENNFNLKRNNINISPQFNEQSVKLSFKCEISVRPAFLLPPVFGGFRMFYKRFSGKKVQKAI